MLPNWPRGVSTLLANQADFSHSRPRRAAQPNEIAFEFSKLGVRDRTRAVLRAIELGVL